MKKSSNLKDYGSWLQVLFKWLYPGIGIKRWIALTGFGILLIIIGAVSLLAEEYFKNLFQGKNVISHAIVFFSGGATIVLFWLAFKLMLYA